MPARKSPIWDFFEEDKSDPTDVLCMIPGCKTRVSRGKTGTTKANLSNAPMTSHLRIYHKKQFGEFQKKKDEKEGTVAEKRKKLDEDEEIEF